MERSLRRTERVQESHRERVLAVSEIPCVLQKKRDVGVVVPVFEPCHNAVFVFELAGHREFFYFLSRSAGETISVVEILPSWREREPVRRLKLRRSGNALPLDRCAALLVLAIIIVSRDAHL